MDNIFEGNLVIDPKSYALLTLLILLGVRSPLEALAKPVETPAPYTKEYFVHQSIQLNRAKDGMNGKLLILLDRCLNGIAEPPMLFAEYEKPKADKPAILEIRDEAGKVVRREDLGSIFVTLREEKLFGDGQSVYFVRKLEQGDHTSQCSVSNLLQVNGGHLRYLTMEDPRSKKQEKLMFISGGELHRGDWNVTPAKNGKGKDILCWFADAPADSSLVMDDPPIEVYITVFTRYHFDGKKWVTSKKKVKGLVPGGFGDGFPVEGSFPKETLFP